MRKLSTNVIALGLVLVAGYSCSKSQSAAHPSSAADPMNSKPLTEPATSKKADRVFTLENCVNEFDPTKKEPTKAGYQYWFADKEFLDGRTLKLSVVDEGKATHSPHAHVEDEFFFVIEGKAEFFLGGKTRVVGPLTSLYCPSNVIHGIRNAGDGQLKYLVVKQYQKV